jgi:hypothetical protein
MELENEKVDIENEVDYMIEEYLESSLHLYSNKDFKEIMCKEILEHFEGQGWKYTDLEEYIQNGIESILLYYQIPPREGPCSENIPKYPIDKCQLQSLSDQNTGQQRTLEWFQSRYELFSASSIWKLLDTPAQYNSLILEKCKPFEYKNEKQIVSNDYNPRNWGVKYEPVSMMVYSYQNPNTIVKTDYGCIPHSQYSFIGASPDGIHIGPEKYGCMVEIKNIFNRDIDGIPLEEYWIQMQIQMETCNLEECDFVETRFKEYETESDFYMDQSVEYKGVILFFLHRDNTKSNKFEYMPLYVSTEDKHSVDTWIQEIQERNIEHYLLYDRSYWYLDEYSCVNIRRNATWFESVIPIFENAWKTVQHERIHGFDHRAPMRSNKKKGIDPVQGKESIRKESIQTESIQNQIKVIKLHG